MTKEERKEWRKKYRERNKEKIKKRMKKYRERNKEEIKKYREENKEYRREYDKNYVEKNKKKIRERNKKWNKENKEYNKKYREKNKEKIREVAKKYREENKEKIRGKDRKYRKKNKEKIRERIYKYRNLRQKTDAVFKLQLATRSLIWHSLKNKNYTKKSSTHKMLGCSYEDFIVHLNNNPYGFTYGQDNLDIDHIVPISSATTEAEVLRLNHYTNFQLLPTQYNRDIKRNNEWDKENFERWLKKYPNFAM